MTLRLRRVVTGHDANGKAIVTVDEVSRNIVSTRPGVSTCVAWTSEGFPVDNNGEADEALRKTGTTHANGTVLHHRVRPRQRRAQPPHGLDRLCVRLVGRDR